MENLKKRERIRRAESTVLRRKPQVSVVPSEEVDLRLGFFYLRSVIADLGLD